MFVNKSSRSVFQIECPEGPRCSHSNTRNAARSTNVPFVKTATQRERRPERQQMDVLDFARMLRARNTATSNAVGLGSILPLPVIEMRMSSFQNPMAGESPF